MHTLNWISWADTLSPSGLHGSKVPWRPGLMFFLTFGLAVAPQCDTPGGINFGGGIQYWFRDRNRLRAEFRDHVVVGERSHHHCGVRVDLSLRGSG